MWYFKCRVFYPESEACTSERQTDRQTYRQTDRDTYIDWNRQAITQANIQTVRQKKHTNNHTNMQTDRQTDRLTYYRKVITKCYDAKTGNMSKTLFNITLSDLKFGYTATL